MYDILFDRDLTYSSTCGTQVRTWAVFGGTRTCTWIFVVLVLEFQILFEYFGKMICPVDVRDANKSLEFLYFLKTYIYLNLKFNQLKYTSTFSPMLPYSSFQHVISVQLIWSLADFHSTENKVENLRSWSVENPAAPSDQVLFRSSWRKEGKLKNIYKSLEKNGNSVLFCMLSNNTAEAIGVLKTPDHVPDVMYISTAPAY